MAPSIARIPMHVVVLAFSIACAIGGDSSSSSQAAVWGSVSSADSTIRGARRLQTDPLLALNARTTGIVAKQAYQYYTVQVPTSFSRFHLSLLPSYGNPDIFVNADGTRPSVSSFTYGSTFYIGTDTVDISYTDRAVRMNCPRSTRPGAVCTFNVAIYGADYAGYAIVASVDGRVLPLLSGSPIVAYGSPGVFTYFALNTTLSPNSSAVTPGTSLDYSFTFTALSGMPGLYVSSSALGTARPNADTPASALCGSFRTDVVSTTVEGGANAIVGRVTVNRGDPCFCIHPCTYYAGVGSATDYSFYSLLPVEYSAGTVVSLLDGVPQDGALSFSLPTASYGFTMVPASSVASSPYAPVVSLSLELYYGSAVLLAMWSTPATASVPLTTATAMYQAPVVQGTASVVVQQSDLQYAAACSSATAPCLLRIAVALSSGGSSSGAYTLVARTNKGVVLNDANPQLSSISPGAVQYFRYTQTDTGDVIIAATPISGTVTLYVGCSAVPGTQQPSANASVWSAVGGEGATGGITTIVIAQLDPVSLSCTFPCTFTIAVVPSGLAGAGETIDFTIMARTRTGQAVSLLDGQPLVDVIEAGDWNYYTANLGPVATTMTLTLSLIANAVSTSSTGNGGASGISVAIAPSLQLYAAAGAYTGVSPASFQYAMPVLTTTGIEATLSISRNDAAVSAGCPPTPGTPAVYANGTLVTPAGPAAPAACVIEILIQSAGPATFVVASITTSRTLLDGVATSSTANPGTAQYFTFDAGMGGSFVQVSLVSLAGTALAYISALAAQPNATTAQYTIGGLGSTSLTLHPLTDGCVAGSTCYYYITVVSAFGTPAIYRLQASSSTVIPLTLGVPVTGVAAPSSFVYYSVYVPPGANAGLSFVAQALSGGFIGLYSTNAVDPATGLTVLPHPVCSATGPGGAQVCDYTNIAGARWGSVGITARDRLAILPTHPAWRNATTYVLAVTAAYPATEFTLTARLGNDPITLSSGSPITDTTMAPGASNYYRILVEPNASTVTVQALPFSGDIMLYVCADASIDPTPNAGSLSAMQDALNLGFSIGVARPLLYFVADVTNSYRVDVPYAALAGCKLDPVRGLCTISVGVVAIAPGTYSVVTSPTMPAGGSNADAARASPTRLVDGQVALGAVAQGQSQIFYLPLRNVSYGSSYWVSVVELVGSTRISSTSNGSFPARFGYIDQTSPSVAGVQLITYAPGSTGYNPLRGPLFVNVWGATGAVFTVCAGVAGNVVELLEGMLQPATATPGQYSYYTLRVSGPTPGPMTFAVTVLAGSVQAYGSRWVNPARNIGFRPSSTSFTYASTGQVSGGTTLTVPAADIIACTSFQSVTVGSETSGGSCMYIFAVLCSGTRSCSYIVSGVVDVSALPRLADGVPAVSTIAPGGYAYYSISPPSGALNLSLSATVSTGSAQLLLAQRTTTNGTAARPWPIVALPTLAMPNSFVAQSLLQPPAISYVQADPPAAADPMRSSTSPAVHPYTVAVACAGGSGASPCALTTRAFWYLDPILLIFGQQVPTTLLTAANPSVQFAVTVVDTSADLVISVPIRSGSSRVTIAVGSRNSVPQCTPLAGSSTGAMICSSATWQVQASVNTAILRISASSPCSGSAVINSASCVPALDWVNGTYIIVVASPDSFTDFSITAFSAAGALALVAGQPQALRQASSDVSQVLVYDVGWDSALPEVRFTIETNAGSASFQWYLTSCALLSCSTSAMNPSASNAAAVGLVAAPTSIDISIPATSPAYCNAPGMTCAYYLSFAPVCLPPGSVCAADFTITPLGFSVSIPYDALAGKVEVIQDGLVPDRSRQYYLTDKANPTDTTSSVTMNLRLDACDTVIGYPTVFLCQDSLATRIAPVGVAVSGNVSNASAPQTPCGDRSHPGSANFEVEMNTSPSAPGGDGSSVLAITGMSPRTYMTTTVYRTQGYPARYAKWGPSSFELNIALAGTIGLWRPLPAQNSNGAISVVAPLHANESSSTAAMFVSWLPPTVTLDFVHNATPAPGSIMYKVFLARKGFLSTAAAATKAASVYDLGLVTGTACGLDRWATLCGAPSVNASILVTNVTSIRIRGLVWGEFYEINVVAMCNEACLAAQASYYGWNLSASGAPTQRAAYAVTGFTVPPFPTHIVEGSLPAEDSVTAVLAPIGITFAVLFLLFAVYVAYKHSLGAKIAAAARAEKLARDHPGIAAFSGPPAHGDGPPVVFVPVSRETVDAHPMSKPYKAPADRSTGNDAQEVAALAARLLAQAEAASAAPAAFPTSSYDPPALSSGRTPLTQATFTSPPHVAQALPLPSRGIATPLAAPAPVPPPAFVVESEWGPGPSAGTATPAAAAGSSTAAAEWGIGASVAAPPPPAVAEFDFDTAPAASVVPPALLSPAQPTAAAVPAPAPPPAPTAGTFDEWT